MKSHIIYYYFPLLVVLLLISCREDRQVALRAEEAQIKRKLTEAASSSHEIQNLLKRFPQERGPAPKPIPKLKNEGKNKDF